MPLSCSPPACYVRIGSLVSVLLVALGNTPVQAQSVTAGGWVPTQTIGEAGSPFQLFDPYKVATDVQGRIIVADTYRSRIEVYDSSATQLLASFPDQPDAPCRMWADDATGNPAHILVSGTPVTCTNGFATAVGLGVGALAQDANRIYVADQENHRIVVLDSSAVSSGVLSYVTQFGTYGSQTIFFDDGTPDGQILPNPVPLADGQFAYPNDVAVWRDGSGILHIYVVDENNRIQDFRPGANNTYTVGFKFGSAGDQGPGAFEYPQGIGVDPANGNLAVADTFNHRVQLFQYPFTGPTHGLVFAAGALDASGQPTVGGGPGEFNLPADVAFDASHRIWVAEWQNQQLQALDGTTGAPLVFIDATIFPGGLGNPQGIWVDTDPARNRVLVAETGSSVSSITALTSVGGQQISASVLVTNNGDVTLDNVVPEAVPEASTRPDGSSTPGLALATPVPVPSSGALTIAPGASHPFTVTLTPEAPGTLSVSFDATGVHTPSGNTIAGAKSAPASVQIKSAAGGALGVSATTSVTSVQVNGTFQLTVVVSNTGDRPLNNVAPTVVPSGTASVSVPLSNPTVACVTQPNGICQLPDGQVFTWTFTITAGASAGQTSLSVNATGTDSLSGTLIKAAAANCTTGVNCPAVQVVSDGTPPTTIATIVGTTNGSGWYNTPVTITFKATDNVGGTGVKHVNCLLGLLVCGNDGSTATLALTDEGSADVTYWAVDVAGNVEARHSLNVKIDMSPPDSPTNWSLPPTTTGWYNLLTGNPTLGFSIADSWSGVSAVWVGGAPGVGLPLNIAAPLGLTLSTEGAAVSGVVYARDVAGNLGGPFKSPTVKIDKTPPTIAALASPASLTGWWNTPVTVTWTNIADALSGINPLTVPQPLRITAEGSTPVSGTVCDIAGNCSTAKLVINKKIVDGVKVDVTAPEVYNQFDPQSKNNVVYQRDKNLPLATVSPQWTPWFWGRDDDGDDDGHDCDGRASEYRTYVISDPAGNTMRLIEKAHYDDKEAHVNVVGFVTTTGCPLHCDVKVGVVPDGTTTKFQWSTNRDGSFNTLDQAMTIGRGSKRIHVEADYDSKKKQTTITQAGRNGFSLTLQGQVLLRMATQNGALVIEFDLSATSTKVISQS